MAVKTQVRCEALAEIGSTDVAEPGDADLSGIRSGFRVRRPGFRRPVEALRDVRREAGKGVSGITPTVCATRAASSDPRKAQKSG